MKETENKNVRTCRASCTGEGKYCSTACEEAGSDEVEIGCGVGHPQLRANLEAKSA